MTSLSAQSGGGGGRVSVQVGMCANITDNQMKKSSYNIVLSGYLEKSSYEPYHVISSQWKKPLKVGGTCIKPLYP